MTIITWIAVIIGVVNILLAIAVYLMNRWLNHHD